MEQEKVLEKIRRLFELSKSKNEFESAAALEKAQELLHRYNLTQADIPTDEKQPYVRELIKLTNTQEWAKSLYHVLAKANGASVIGLPREGRGCIAVIGQRHTLEILEYSYAQMEKRIRWLADTAWDIYEGHERDMATYKKAFALGIIGRLQDRLKKTQQKLEDESPDSKALVKVSDAELERAVTQWYPKLISVRGPSVYSDGFTDGQRAGKHLQVHAGVGQGQGVRRLN